jgi:hypothetical protein
MVYLFELIRTLEGDLSYGKSYQEDCQAQEAGRQEGREEDGSQSDPQAGCQEGGQEGCEEAESRLTQALVTATALDWAFRAVRIRPEEVLKAAFSGKKNRPVVARSAIGHFFGPMVVSAREKAPDADQPAKEISGRRPRT